MPAFPRADSILLVGCKRIVIYIILRELSGQIIGVLWYFQYAIAGFEQYYIGLVTRDYRAFVGYAKVHYTFEESGL